jgi:colanic acid biosynthesis glycosyl transferase WcaI
MKILLYSVNFAPEPVGIGKYSGEMAAWLVAQGHEVRVVCAPPYYPDWKLDDAYEPGHYYREQWQDVLVFRAPLWVPKQPGGLKRIFHLASFALSSLPVMLSQCFWRPDVVFTVAPALICAPTGYLVAKLCNARSWLHVQDFEVDVAFQMGLLKGRRLKTMALGMERWLLCRFDMLSSISGNMIKHLLTKGRTRENTFLFPNWVDIDHVAPLKTVSSYRAELGIAPNATVAMFSGTLGGKQGLIVIPEAAKRLLHRKDIVLVICGNGAFKPLLQTMAEQLPNLKLLPLQPFERLSDLLGMADIHLLPQSQDAEDLVLPSKLSGMLASGRPVIATCHAGTEIANVISECGMVVEPSNSLELAQAIEKLADHPELRLQLGINARYYAESHVASDSVLSRLEGELEVQVYGEPPLGAIGN